MGTFQFTTPHALKLPASPLTVQSMEIKVNAVASEVNFYHKLLSWCLFSCREEQRPEIENLREAVAHLRNAELPVLFDNLKHLAGIKDQGELTPPPVQYQFQHIDDAFQALKSKIQRGFGEFTHICIW